MVGSENAPLENKDSHGEPVFTHTVYNRETNLSTHGTSWLQMELGWHGTLCLSNGCYLLPVYIPCDPCHVTGGRDRLN